MQPLVPLVFHNLYPRNDAFWLCQCTIYNIGAKREICIIHATIISFLIICHHCLYLPFLFFFRYAARGDRTRTAPLRHFATNLYAIYSHKPRIVHTTIINTCARGRSRRGTLSKMASFIVDLCRDLRFSLEMWDWRRTIAWGRCTPLIIVDQFGIN